MADVFISYAKTDRTVTEQLAAQLEAKGLTVWWDKEIVLGEEFRNVILEQLEKARAAIVVWTPAAVKSDWVIAEATRARARKILIPVRQPDVGVDDIPMPFGNLHTDLVTNGPAIDAALAKLGVVAKPGLSPSPPKPAPHPTPFPIRWLMATVVGVAVLAGTGAYLYWPRPPVEQAIIWTDLPAGTRLANLTPAPIATFVEPDTASARSVDIEPGQTIPPSGTDQRLARATLKGGSWLRFPIGNGDRFAYVPERAVKLLPGA
jgi:hypothetical protein